MSRFKLERVFPVYPFLLGIIWVLLTYASNKEILPSAGIVVMPILVVLGAIAAAFVVSYLVSRDVNLAALVSSLLFLLTIAHGYVRNYTGVQGTYLAVVWLALIVIGIVAVGKLTRPKGRVHLTVIGSVVSVSILIVSLVAAFTGQYAVASPPKAEPVAINSMLVELPSVYYIVPDTYASNYVLREYFGYNNSSFTGWLEGKGFDVVDESYANYHHSILSISSVLNMRYWTDEDLGNPAARKLGQYIYDNPVALTFKEAGYTNVHLGSWWGFTAGSSHAGIVVPYSNLSELDFLLLRLTLWYDLLDLVDRGGDNLLREAHLSQVRNLVTKSAADEPVFVFCHMILPHSPYLFDATGNPVTDRMADADILERMYLDQLTFTNSLLRQAIDEILARHEVTPIIVVAADEGNAGSEWYEYWVSKRGLHTITEDRPHLVTMRQGAFFAVLNPYGDTPSSPVNIFRSLFNDLFGSQLEILPDRYFLKSLSQYEHEFIEVTEWLMNN